VKLQQLRYLKAICEHGLNVTEAAEHLYTSQPGISKQIRLLEDELGLELFNRNGKSLSQLTPAGRQVLERATAILQEVQNIRTLAEEFKDDEKGDLRVATTHTQARYLLPRIIETFRARYPQVRLHLDTGTPGQIARMAAGGDADFAIATEAIGETRELVMMPAYRWNRCAVVPRDHPLTKVRRLSLQVLAAHPLVTYVREFTGRAQMDADFRAAGLEPDVVLSAADADVVKTYVRLGLGVGIIARMTYEPDQDRDLVALDAGHLFREAVTRIGFRRGSYMRGYMYAFLELFAPHLDTRRVNAAAHAESQDEVDALFREVELPLL
jgi:LysR family cys regulon transcriptional activator